MTALPSPFVLISCMSIRLYFRQHCYSAPVLRPNVEIDVGTSNQDHLPVPPWDATYPHTRARGEGFRRSAQPSRDDGRYMCLHLLSSRPTLPVLGPPLSNTNNGPPPACIVIAIRQPVFRDSAEARLSRHSVMLSPISGLNLYRLGHALMPDGVIAS